MNASNKSSATQSLCAECMVRDHCLARHLPLSELDAIHDGKKRFTKGSYLLRQGDPVPYLYSMQSGCAKSFTNTLSSEEPTRQFYYPGDMIGLDAFVQQTSPVNIVALQDCYVCVFPLSALKAATQRAPSAQDYIVQSFANAATQAYELSIVASAEKRLAAFFVNFSERQAGLGFSRTSLVLPMSRMEIANYLRLAHETVSRALFNLRRKRLLEVSARSVRIVSFDALTEIADGARQ
jgi:CRP/FNR family transcriptional regulator